MEDDAKSVLRSKKDSSLGVAFQLLKAGEGDALVSAGQYRCRDRRRYADHRAD